MNFDGPLLQSLLLLLIQLGLITSTYLVLQICRIPIETIRSLFLDRELRDDLPQSPYDEVYGKENKWKLPKANMDLAYKKLYALNSAKSTDRKISDLKSVIALNLPATFQQIRLLSKALVKQRDHKLKFLIFEHLIKLRIYLRKRDATISSLLSSFLYLYWVYAYKILDKIYATQLILFICTFSLLLFLFIFLSYKNGLQVFIFCSLVMLIYLYMYSNSIHNGITIAEDKTQAIKMECPNWIKEEDIKSCNNFIYTNSTSTNSKKIKVIYDDTLYYIKNQECKISPSTDFIVSSSSPFIFFLAPKTVDTLKKTNAKVSFAIEDSNGIYSTSNSLNCSINLENPIWSSLRTILTTMTGTSTLIAILFEVAKKLINIQQTI